MKQSLVDFCIENNKQYLINEWDYEKNNSIGLFIDKVSYGSGKTANWICKNNHEYKKRIDARTSNNSKCPYCESRKKALLVGANDLATLYPKLIKEWDCQKNIDIQPNNILSTSDKKVWWKCQTCNSSWQASIRQRTIVGQGCPYCAHIKPIIGTNDLQTLFPELIKDWNYKKNKDSPSSFTAFSGKKVWWQCHYCGHEWQTAINNRTYNKRNCPACTMKTTSFGEQALFYYIKKIFPDAINRYHEYGIELDIYIPSTRIGIEFDGLFWHNDLDSAKREQKKYAICKQNNIKLIRIRDSRAEYHHNTCDYNIGIDNLQNINQLNNIIRILLKEIDPESNSWTRKNPYQIWSTIDSQINVEKDRFKILENKFLREEKNSFIYDYPKIYHEWNYDKNQSFNPKAFTKSSTRKVWWKCSKCGYEWQAKIVDRTSGHNKCPVCSNHVLKEGVNDFATLYPNLLTEWNYNKNIILPNEILKRHKTKVWWKCKKCEHEWLAAIGERTRMDKPSGCPKCKIKSDSEKKHQKAILRGSLIETHPELLVEWDYDRNKVKPNEVTHGSGLYVWRKCQYCGNSWQTSLNNWTRKKSKCPKCKKKD